MTGRFERLAQRAAEIEAQGLARRLRPLRLSSPTTGELEGRPVDVFSSNDYLGLAEDLRDEWRGAGAGSSRLIAGDRPAHHELEDALEERFGQPALVFGSGFAANLALMSTLFEAGDRVLSDALNHASLIDGLRLSKAERVVYPHGRCPPGGRAVVVEGLFSMDGDRPDFSGLQTEERWLVVDEAHAVGCIGPGGRGAAADAGIQADVLVGTFGKAYGAAGAFVVGPASLKALLISAGRSFVYTTGLAEAAARAALAGLRAADEERRQRLASRTLRFRAGLAQMGVSTTGRDHVVPVVLGPRTMEVAARLLDAGVWAPGIRWPTVPAGQERLRFSLSAAHSDAQIDRALQALGEALR